jgi:hypothetical protein
VRRFTLITLIVLVVLLLVAGLAAGTLGRPDGPATPTPTVTSP